jgi:hypothetical protein
MGRAGEQDREEEAKEKMNTIYSIVNALHSIWTVLHLESVESGVLYSTIFPGSGNVIVGKAVLIRNDGCIINESLYILHILTTISKASRIHHGNMDS